MLDVGDGHRVSFETLGAPDAPPAVVLHGGPGSGCTAWHRELLDPRRHRVVLLDQRGCGRSTPHASEPGADLSAITTQHLIGDLERLRAHLGIERWLVVGGSWGSTLGLAYAQAHPEAVSGCVLFSVVTTTRREVERLTRELGAPDPAAQHRRLMDPDPAVHEPAAAEWCRWEASLVPSSRYDDPRFRLAFARLVTRFWAHAAWLGEDELLEGVERLGGVPAVLIHGRLDAGAPLDVPQRLARRWPGAELIVIDDEGHDGGPAMDAAIRAAARRLSAHAALR